MIWRGRSRISLIRALGGDPPQSSNPIRQTDPLVLFLHHWVPLKVSTFPFHWEQWQHLETLSHVGALWWGVGWQLDYVLIPRLVSLQVISGVFCLIWIMTTAPSSPMLLSSFIKSCIFLCVFDNSYCFGISGLHMVKKKLINSVLLFCIHFLK